MAAAVLEYLDHHPLAMDNFDGIASWWLMWQRFRVELATLEKVLTRLTKDHVLETVGPRANPCYRRRR